MVDEVHGFRSFDERDVLGFVDGTENPEGAAAADAVLIGDEDPAYAGGSYAIVQKYLIGYASTSELIEEMLSNMFIGQPPGTTDRILDFSTAATGGLFFVPALEQLEALADAADGETAAPAEADAPDDGSLGIGSLREPR